MKTAEAFSFEQVLFGLVPVKLALEGMMDAAQGGITREPLTRLEMAALHNSLSAAYYMLERQLPDYSSAPPESAA